MAISLNLNPENNPFGIEWGHHALNDPTLLGAILYHASVHLDIVHRGSWSKESLYRRGESIRRMNGRLSSSESINDSTVLAVALIGRVGNLEEASALCTATWRLNGLLISSKITIMKSPPSIPRPVLDEGVAFRYSLKNNCSNIRTSRNTDILTYIRILSSLSKVGNILSKSTGALKPEIISFIRQCAIAEHDLLSIEPILPTEDHDNLKFYVYESYRVATLICINYTFRSFCPAGYVYDKLLEQLVETRAPFGNHDIKALFSRNEQEMLLWTYFVGGILSKEKAIFAQKIEQVISGLGLQGGRKVRHAWRKVLWTNKVQHHERVQT
ncbi:hypothetical protein G7Y89_g1442 [Cudoniella acicularis]|uniref:Uncharacterized protein n=1 Tax=Cudoniella acicularis TaxID=354080 RepID=A0A8H4RWW9_9HELO|nr:hypothetical protein G7Y89_g1442 [Cudoniella acicularis]